jgi:hypothetical protein
VKRESGREPLHTTDGRARIPHSVTERQTKGLSKWSRTPTIGILPYERTASGAVIQQPLS